MTQAHAALCEKLKLPVLEETPNYGVKTGFVMVLDINKSVFDLSSFEATEEGTVFPARYRSEMELDILLSAAIRLAQACPISGFLTVMFVLQPEGTEYAVIDVEEGLSGYALGACALYGIDAEAALSKLRMGGSAADFGYLPEPMKRWVVS